MDIRRVRKGLLSRTSGMKHKAVMHMCLLRATAQVIAMLPPLTAGSPSVLLAVERANRMSPMTGEIDGGQRMTGTEVRAVFEELWPPGEMNRLCRPCGVIERQRTLHLAMLVRALVISAGTPGGADPADILRASLESEVPRVTRAAFDRWFDAPLERSMAALAQRALA
jgi:hypothetical protein